MIRHALFPALAALCALFAQNCVFNSTARADSPETLLAWEFNSGQDVAQWRPSNMTPLKCENGALQARPTGWDPFVVSPHFELKPRPGQYVEIRMKSIGAGVGEIFWASSDEGRYNGFSQAQTARWTIIHDGEFHVYQIMPAWLAEPQIIKIRVDVGVPTEDDIKNDAETVIDYIRILDLNLEEAAPVERTDWSGEALDAVLADAGPKSNLWISKIGIVDPKKAGDNIYVEWERDPNAEYSEPLERASLKLITEQKPGEIAFDIPLFSVASVPSGNVLAKNVDLSAINPSDAPFYRWEIRTPANIKLRRVAVTKTPIGEGVVESQDPWQRELARISDGHATLRAEATFRNSGGEPLANLFAIPQNGSPAPSRVVLQKTVADSLLGFNPSGDRLTAKALDASKIDSREYVADAKNGFKFPADFTLAPGEAAKIVADFDAYHAGEIPVAIGLGWKSGKNDVFKQEAVFRAQLRALPEADLPKGAKYVPAPVKVESDYEIGAYYFPGWSKRAGWDKIRDAAPLRKSLLGYYDEGSSEVVDWQIKWAAENGIQFFFVDWYWLRGEVRLEHWVRAFQKAKHRSALKWAVMWANHTGPGTHSTEDWKKVAKYWIDNYFNTPEYYTIDGKPVVVIWDRSIVDNDMIAEAAKNGEELKPGEGCKRAFEIARQTAVDAGYKGIYFIAVTWPERATDAGTIQKLADDSFDATTIYHFMYPGKELESQLLYSFDAVVNASRPNWEERHETGIIPFLPGVSTGWDSRPWHGFRSTIVYDRNVESFKRLLKDYRDFADKKGVKRVVLGPVNEWGEGSYIEPNLEFGFGMYEAIREVLCKRPEGGFPVNYAPSEIGLGPYDLPEKEVLRPEDHF